MADIFSTALQLAADGFCLFPLAAGTKSPHQGTRGFLDASKDAKQIERWFDYEYPLANIGIATGEISDLVVLDFDPRNGGEITRQRLILAGALPETLVIETGGGGHHYYYNYPKGKAVGCSKPREYPGMDIKGNGGYVVGPGSFTEKEYKVLGGAPVLLPAWVSELSPKPRDTGLIPGRATAELPEGKKGLLAKRTRYFLEHPEEFTGVGSWHDEWTAMCRDFVQQGYDMGEAEDKIVEAGIIMDSNHDFYQLRWHYMNWSPSHPPRLLPEGDIEGAGQLPAGDAEESPDVPAADYVQAMFTALADKGRTLGCATGLKQFDEAFGGGKRLGELTLLVASAKAGKSSLYHYMMHSWLSQGIPVGYASREMKPELEVIPALLSIELGINVVRLAVEDRLTSQIRKECEEKVAKWPLHFARGYGKFPLTKMTEWVDALVAKGVKYFFIDHLHYCLSGVEDWAESVELAQGIKHLANTRLIHIDLIVQPGKYDENKPMGMHSMRGGAGINQVADNILIFERHKESDKENLSNIRMDRVRWPLARKKEITLEYNPETRAFKELPYPVPMLYGDKKDDERGKKPVLERPYGIGKKVTKFTADVTDS